MLTSDNQTLRSLSWLIRNRFVAVSRAYGILSPLQSVVSKMSRHLHGQSRFRFYLTIIVLLYFVLLTVCVYVRRRSVFKN